ncbi:hypothetical protein [Neolewinella agarilytica]|uniref:hypothetical protein n=1 Tax=Neolewinella agarilytica TaxID=478744 RepID=UPI0023536B71|nr:hypothetical protein [Neolewinella agarilytica]
MRTFLLLLMAACFCSCSFFQKITGKTPAASEVVEAPTNLEGPAYDPATSPRVMTSSTPLPTAAGTTTTNSGQPAAYGQAPSTAPASGQPATYSQPSATPVNGGQPEVYGQAGNAPSTYSAPATAPQTEAKGGVAAPTAYGSTTTMAPPTGEAAVLAATLNGLWVNSVDPNEVVEFTTDHYSTFYEGQLLIQEPMEYHARCPGDCADGQEMEIACFTITGPAGTDCYGIIRMTPDVLELSMLGVSTETIVYRKK